jgi:hypothetical protein
MWLRVSELPAMPCPRVFQFPSDLEWGEAAKIFELPDIYIYTPCMVICPNHDLHPTVMPRQSQIKIYNKVMYSSSSSTKIGYPQSQVPVQHILQDRPTLQQTISHRRGPSLLRRCPTLASVPVPPLRSAPRHHRRRFQCWMHILRAFR